MAEPLRHRQTKEAATDMFDLKPPRHISTLHIALVFCGGQSLEFASGLKSVPESMDVRAGLTCQCSSNCRRSDRRCPGNSFGIDAGGQVAASPPALRQTLGRRSYVSK